MVYDTLMSEIWHISDSHFFHANIIKYCNRPFTTELEMNAAMLCRWNDRVQEDDIVIHVGDLSAGLGPRKKEFGDLIGSLKGQKILIKGNHDHQKDAFYLDHGFLHVCEHLFINGLLWSHVPGVDQVEHPHPMGQITRDLQEKHKPALTIHGHVHRTDIPEYPGHFNCASDRHDHTPFTLRSLLERSNVGNLADNSYEAVTNWVNDLKEKKSVPRTP